MFGMGGRATGLAEKRLGYTSIKRPSSGRSVEFGKMVAGDFFTYEGRLYLKTNLVEGVEIGANQTPTFGVSQFSAECNVQVETVEISIK